MLYPAELRGRYLTIYLRRAGDAITGEMFSSYYGDYYEFPKAAIDGPVRTCFYC